MICKNYLSIIVNFIRTPDDIDLMGIEKQNVIKMTKKVHDSFGFQNLVGKNTFNQMMKFECWVNDCAKGHELISKDLK